MDSLLANAQRCGRTADQLAKYGMYDEALEQLEKSIVHLKELKNNITNISNLDNVNLQIEHIDRKMITIAIKRTEDAKKKAQIEYLIKNKEFEGPLMLPNNQTPGGGYYRGLKLIKDDKSLIEELTTTNLEFKKVNLFLINEIELLKKENVYLKNELLKQIHKSSTNDTTSTSGSVGGVGGSTGVEDALAALSVHSKDALNKQYDQNEEDDENGKGQYAVDLSKYVNSDNDGSDSDDSLKNNRPPLEFTVDS